MPLGTCIQYYMTMAFLSQPINWSCFEQIWVNLGVWKKSLNLNIDNVLLRYMLQY